MRTKLSAVEGDITLIEADAIVNAANSSLLGGGGVDGAIHRAAGKKLKEECRTLGGCTTGNAKITGGYDLKSTYVIHTVGPVWQGGGANEKILLRNCYLNSLRIASEKGLKTIAFPSISTGAYGYPIREASSIAVSTVLEYLKNDNSFDEIIFVCFNNADYEIYSELLSQL